MPLSILIIDDDDDFKRILEKRLRSFFLQLEITAFSNLKDTREFINAGDKAFDLVILDQHLPDGAGLELLNEGCFENLAVLAISSDDNPEIPGASVQAGAAYFLEKRHISEPLFRPLVRGIIDRNRLQAQLEKSKMDTVVMDTVRTLVGTLRHEINNPLGAVLGAAYIIRSAGENASKDQKEAAEIVESSGKRIKHVLDELCKAVSLEPVTKGSETVFHIPGDKPWKKDK